MLRTFQMTLVLEIVGVMHARNDRGSINPYGSVLFTAKEQPQKIYKRTSLYIIDMYDLPSLM